MMNLGLNPGQMVHTVPYWVDCCVDQYFIMVSLFMLMSNAMVTEDHLHSNTKYIGEVCTRECIVDANIFSIVQILARSLADPMFVEYSGMNWFDSEWFGSTLIESESLWFQITDFLRWTFSTSKLFLRAAFSKNLLPPSSSLSLFSAPCNGNPL